LLEPIRISLVDDLRTARNHCAGRLRDHGCRVEPAADVKQARACLEQEAVDLAIVDFFMPRANGDVLCRLIRAEPRWRHITAVILIAVAKRSGPQGGDPVSIG